MTISEQHVRSADRQRRGRRLLTPLLAALIVAAPLLPFGPPASGQTASQSRLDKIRAELRDAKTDADKNQKLLDQVNAQIRQVKQQLRRAREQEKSAGVELDQATQLATQASDDVNRLRQQVGARARAVYMTCGTGQLGALTGAESPEVMLERVSRLDSLAREDSRVMPDLLTALQLAQEARERILAADKARVEALEEITRRGEELRETKGVRTEAQQKLDQRVEQFRENIAVILQESAALRAELGGSSGSGNVGTLLRPVGCPQTSGFGIRWGRMHEGLDFGCPIGTPVKAAKAGLVIKAGVSSGYGNLVLVDHSDGVVTAYAHNSSFRVGVGDEVSAGQIIALSGNTGRSTGPHVHFEVRINGVPKNPAIYL